MVAVDGMRIWHHLGWRVPGRCVEEKVWKSLDPRIENGRNGLIGLRRKKDGWVADYGLNNWYGAASVYAGAQ